MLAVTLVLATAMPSIAANAQDVSAFYAGKTVPLIVGFPTGGGSDLFGRAVVRHIGTYIPGSPRVILQNMPGAGSIIAANYMFNTAPKDGTVLGGISQGAPLGAKLGNAQSQFDPAKFNWIGRLAPTPAVTMVRSDSKVDSIEQTLSREVTLSATGAGSTVSLFPAVMNKVLQTKFKIILGYKGSAEAMLAMDRGEVEGHSTSWVLVNSIHPDWIQTGKVRILVQHGLSRMPELPNVPTSVEIAKGDDNRAIMHAIMASSEIGHSYFTTPDVPTERVAALRKAFDDMISEPQFVSDVVRTGGEVRPLTGEAMQKLIGELDAMSPALLERIKEIYPVSE